MKPVTLEEYKEVSPEFFPKYEYVREQLPEGSSTEDVLRIMETLSMLAMKKRAEETKPNVIGFNREIDDGQTEEEGQEGS